MVKIEALIQPHKLEEVRAALTRLGITRTLILHVIEHGDGARKAYYRGAEYPADLPRIKLEILSGADRADEIVAAVLNAARASIPGVDDGMILVTPVADAIRIHNGAHLQYTLT